MMHAFDLLLRAPHFPFLNSIQAALMNFSAHFLSTLKSYPQWVTPAAVVAGVLSVGSSFAQTADCNNVSNDQMRLICYDKQNGRKAVAPPAAVIPAPGADEKAKSAKATDAAEAAKAANVTNAPDAPNAANTASPAVASNVVDAVGLRLPLPLGKRDSDTIIARRTEAQAKAGRTLTEAWDLDPKLEHSLFELRAYKPMHVLVGTHTNSINRQPSSSQLQNTVSTPVSVSSNEAQFQVSFKSKVWDNLIQNNGSIWLGYTQSSRWQIYSPNQSRPFRETNYEPEAMLVFRTPYEIAGWEGRMTELSVVHQSNGRALPLSRSWNRVIAQLGLERGDWMVLVRPWWRIPEKHSEDDNPGIENYVGRGELIVAKRYGSHVFSLQARHSLRGGDRSRGSVKLDWSLPLSGYLKAHLEIFSGYGESLVDFNHRQTMISAGISLVEWR